MWTLTIVLSLLGFLLTLILTTLLRLAHGASWQELARTRCFEIVPLRGLFRVLLVVLAAAFVLDVCVLLKNGYWLFSRESQVNGSIGALLLSGLLAAPLGLLSLLVYRRLVVLPLIEARPVNVENVIFQKGIPPEDYTTLGTERFPNHIAPEQRTDNWIRGGVVLAALATVVILIATHSSESRQPPAQVIPANPPPAPAVKPAPEAPPDPAAPAQKPASPAPAAKTAKPATPSPEPVTLGQNLGLFLVIACALLLGTLLYNNRDYTLMPFRPALLVELGLCAVLLVALALMRLEGQPLTVGLGVLSVVCGLRAGADLRLAWRYRRMKKVYDPIADQLRYHAPYLHQVPLHPDFKLPALDQAALAQRVAEGCKNVEDRGLLVTRHFNRFMRLLNVEHDDFAVAMLRYLTVRRYVTLIGGIGTILGLRYPQVPMWDLVLFPLHPPKGYVNWLDPLTLGSEWDVVMLCGTCGGSGIVTRTVTETDSQGRSTSRQVQETCTTCGGCGRLLYHQVLNTQWQRLLPQVTHPEIPMAELVEDAEEVTHCQLRLTEDFRDLPPQPRTCGAQNPLMTEMLRTAQAVAALHVEHTAMVEKLHAGRLYRADFQVCGFRTICIRFERLRGRVGWFFGRRPEFYFPRLPLSWSALGTIVFLPPLALALAAGMIALASVLL
jgi:hypothetical protein